MDDVDLFAALRARTIPQNADAETVAILEAAIRAAIDVTPQSGTVEDRLYRAERCLMDALRVGYD